MLLPKAEDGTIIGGRARPGKRCDVAPYAVLAKARIELLTASVTYGHSPRSWWSRVLTNRVCAAGPTRRSFHLSREPGHYAYGVGGYSVSGCVLWNRMSAAGF